MPMFTRSGKVYCNSDDAIHLNASVAFLKKMIRRLTEEGRAVFANCFYQHSHLLTEGPQLNVNIPANERYDVLWQTFQDFLDEHLEAGRVQGTPFICNGKILKGKWNKYHTQKMIYWFRFSMWRSSSRNDQKINELYECCSRAIILHDHERPDIP